MKNNQTSQMTRLQRFDQYVALLAEAVDHPDRAEPLRDYCTGLLLPVKRKSIEPIAAQVAHGRIKAKHQSLQQFITDAPWRDRPALWVAYNYALPALRRHGGVKATIVDDTGIPKKGSHSVGVARHIQVQACGNLYISPDSPHHIRFADYLADYRRAFFALRLPALGMHFFSGQDLDPMRGQMSGEFNLAYCRAVKRFEKFHDKLSSPAFDAGFDFIDFPGRCSGVRRFEFASQPPALDPDAVKMNSFFRFSASVLRSFR